MNHDHIADAESYAEHMDDNSRTLLGVGQQLRRIADALEAVRDRPLVVSNGDRWVAIDMSVVTDFNDLCERLALVTKTPA